MKQFYTILFVIVGIFFTISAEAQTFTDAGTAELGGTLGFSSQTFSMNGSSQSNSISTFSFYPYLGEMITSGFELGVMPGYTLVTEGTSSLAVFNLYLAPSFNVNTKSNLYPFFEFLFGYNSIRSGTGTNSKTDGLGIGLDLGLKANIAGNSLLLVQLQYLSQNYERRNTTLNSSGTISQTLNTFSFGVGFRVFLQKKKEEKK